MVEHITVTMVDRDQALLITEQDLDQLMLQHIQDNLMSPSPVRTMVAFSTETILGNHQFMI